MSSSQASGLTLDSIFIRIKLAALWTSLMLLYIYADIFSLYRPGMIDKIRDGFMGPFEASQTTIAVAAAMLAIPALMVAGSFLFSMKITKISTISLGALFTLVNISNLVGEVWIYYLAYGAIEIIITISIVVLAWRWQP
ncbi:DUF6326 family protein [Reinekea sp.]|jgi:hypothetical protein|uniref:DUF6326 family protein n=1 Tax=Reinekea sp. TaxID=1970455 RepID=UPI003988E9D3